MEGLLATEGQIVEILIIVSIVAILVRRVRLPYTVALVLAGLVLAFQGQLELELTPELVLGIFVPPLIFEAAFHLQLRNLRIDVGPILTMAVAGVLISTLVVGGILTMAGVLPWSVALLFGALISATDPVAVVAMFRAVGAPNRLTTLMEGESLFNDGTAVVLFHIMGGLVLAGALSPVDGIVQFLSVSTGGILIGSLLGYTIARIIARIDDYLIEITLTTILVYGSYLLAEELHVSGVLAVVAAGLFNGNLGTRGMSPTTRIVLYNFWEYVAFLANSFIFILIGLSVPFDDLVQFLQPALIAVVSVLVARAVAVYGLGFLFRLFKVDLRFPYLHVMAWGGLRGAISLALALGIPLRVGERHQLLAMTFAVVLFTLLVQATTISPLLVRLGFTRKSGISIQYERLQGELLALRAAHSYLDQLYNEGALIPTAYTTVREELEQREQELDAAIVDLLAQQPELKAQILALARLEVLRAQRSALEGLTRDGLLSEEALAELQADLDDSIDKFESGRAGEAPVEAIGTVL